MFSYFIPTSILTFYLNMHTSDVITFSASMLNYNASGQATYGPMHGNIIYNWMPHRVTGSERIHLDASRVNP